MSHLSLEELELIDEPKYRNYINFVDKALKNFEYTSEWADLIAALGKLNKVMITVQIFPMKIYMFILNKCKGSSKPFQV